MAQNIKSAKRQLIEKSRSTMFTYASIALFVTVFSLISAHNLLDKLSYQSRVISAATSARNQLKKDEVATQKLTSAYQKFNNTKVNLLGSSVTGVTNDNAKIILDALPSTYDYPALTTSIQDMLSNHGVTIDSIGGTDESATYTNSPSSSTPIAMPFTFSIDGPYQNVQNVINTFEKSIRPFQFQSLSFSGNESDVTLTANAQTFFLPATQFNITTENVQ